METLRKLILQVDPNFFKNIDPNLKTFAREIRWELRKQGHVVMGLTGYPGVGKSNDAAVIGCLIDREYKLDTNLCYIPTSKQIEQQYLNLPMYSYLHIDEASRGLHKHKWYDSIQQKLNLLYDTEREGHYLCSTLIMPRFQNFTENFRNFMITYWIHVPRKGIALFYKKDEDKDAKDPWHIDENYRMKLKKVGFKRTFEISTGEKIRLEQYTKCYWFYCKVPKIPDEVWKIYQEEKKKSRVEAKELEDQPESYRDKVSREKKERWRTILKLKKQGKTHVQISVILGCSLETIRKTVRQIETYLEMSGNGVKPHKPY